MITRVLFGMTILLAVAICSAASSASAQGVGKLPTIKPPKSKTSSSTRKSGTRKTQPGAKSSAGTGTMANPATSSPVSVNYAREPEATPQLSFNVAVEGRLTPQTSGRITATSFYDEYKLTATAADLFTIRLETPDPSLQIQIFDSNHQGLPIRRAGDFEWEMPDKTLPADGEYRVRILKTDASDKAPAIAYTLNINRTGLTEQGYQTRFEQIIKAFNASEGKNAREAIAGIEELVRLDPKKSRGYEMLGVLWLYHGQDLNKAVGLMEQAIRLGGAATFQVAYTQGRKPDKKDVANLSKGWLSIRPDQAEMADLNSQRRYFSISGKQVREINRSGSSPLIEIKPSTKGSKSYWLQPVSENVQEAETISNMLKTYVQKQN